MSPISQILLIIAASISCLSISKQNISVYTQNTKIDNGRDPLEDFLFCAEHFADEVMKEDVNFTADHLQILRVNGITKPKHLINIIDEQQCYLLFQSKALNITEVRCIQKYIECGIQRCKKNKPKSKKSNTNNREISESDSEIDGSAKKEDEDDEKIEANTVVNADQIDLFVVTEAMVKGVKRMTLGPNCILGLVKELCIIAKIYQKRESQGNARQKGTWIYENELDGHKSTLRRKKPAWKLIAYDHEEFIGIEAKYKHKKVNYMQKEHADEVIARTKELIQQKRAPRNPIFFCRYCEVFGDLGDKATVAAMDRESRDADYQYFESYL